MGFWHTGYLDMRDMGPPGVAWTPHGTGATQPPPPSYPCPWCHETFDSPAELEQHTFRGHHEPQPLLLFRGRECGTSPVEVLAVTSADDWAALRADRAWVNEASVEPDQLATMLAEQDQATVDVRLAAGEIESSFRLQFAIADPVQLEVVDEHLLRLAQGKQLDLRAIEGFLRSCDELGAAARYVDGFAEYFFGVLARERSPDSALEHEEYVSKYDAAATVLSQFDRAPARTISALIAFHFNQFARASALDVEGGRLSAAATRLRTLLHEQGTATSDHPDSSTTGLDAVFADAEAERILAWVSLPFAPTSDDEFEAAAAFAQNASTFDQVKLNLVLAEHHARMERPDRAHTYANSLLNNNLTENWARRMRARLDSRD